MPTDPSLLQRGAHLAQTGEYREALSAFNQILFEEPDHSDALFMAGACHFKLNEFSEARKVWTRVLATDPQHEKARAWLAKLPPEEPAFGAAPQDGGWGGSSEPAPVPPPPRAPNGGKVPSKAGRTNLYTRLAIATALVAAAAFGFDMYQNPNSYSFLRKEMTDLRWKWNVGETLRYRAAANVNFKMAPAESAGQDSQADPMAAILGQMLNIQASGNAAMVFKQTVKEVGSDGSATLDLEVESFDFQSNLPGGQGGAFSYKADAPAAVADSTGPATGSAQAVPEVLTFKISPNGKVEIPAEMKKEFEESLREAALSDPMTASMAQIPTGDSLEQAIQAIFELVFGSLPAVPVAEEGTWNTRHENHTPGAGGVSVDTAYTLSGKELVGNLDCAKIVSNSVVQIDLQGMSQQQAAAMPFPGEFTPQVEQARGNGTLHFCPDKGRTVRNANSLAVVVALEMKLPSQPGAGEVPAMKAKVQLDANLNVEML